ncbi:MAG TPA: peptide chain release factor N(5)-glutamine methyltransferase [Chitinophagaceae bacterium]|nr:peptide chain release factor N(5)-glutamine methyltransferase [Chitinophagaceae bacterium]
MRFSEARQIFKQRVSEPFPDSELDELLMRTLEHLTGNSRQQIRLHEFNLHDTGAFNAIVDQLNTGRPVQYILGYEWFGDLKLHVNESVLIPRPETYELVQWATEILQTSGKSPQTLLDMGTGSGCIALSLKNKFPSVRVLAADISRKALEVATANAAHLQLDIQTLPLNMLCLDPLPVNQVDMIISNPPYIAPEEANTMERQVLEFEPPEALFVTNRDPLQFYKALAQYAIRYLAADGHILMELNQEFAKDTEDYFKQLGFQTMLRKDMYGNYRMLKCKNPMQ